MDDGETVNLQINYLMGDVICTGTWTQRKLKDTDLSI